MKKTYKERAEEIIHEIGVYKILGWGINIDLEIHKAQDLKQKIKSKGCGKIWDNIWLCGNKSHVMRRYNRFLCPDCQEALKILNEVLE